MTKINITMPKSCESCPISFLELDMNNDMELKCPFQKLYVTDMEDERAKGCPLEENIGYWKWIPYDNNNHYMMGHFYCSKCNHTPFGLITEDFPIYEYFKYCSTCGAEMKENK